MSVGTYITELLNNYEMTPKKLAKKLDMSYQNVMKLKNDESILPSTKVIKKLAKFEKRKEPKVVYDILMTSIDAASSLEVLDYLSKKACEGYTIELGTNYLPISQKTKPHSSSVAARKDNFARVYFGGSAFKKRSGNTFTVVDSWDTLKVECFSQFKSSANIIHSKNAWASIFCHESHFYNNVINYALSKLSQYDENVINYVIVTNYKNKNEIEKISRPITTSNVNFIFEYSNVKYSSKYLRLIDYDYLRDLGFFMRTCDDSRFLPQNDINLLAKCDEAFYKFRFSPLKSNTLANEAEEIYKKLKLTNESNYADYLPFLKCNHGYEIQPALFYDLLEILQDFVKCYERYIHTKFPFNTIE